MTNLFIRVKRSGEWQAIDLAEATPEERHAFFCTLPPPALVRWLGALCEVLDKKNNSARVAR